MNWIAILAGALSLLNSLVSWLRDTKRVSEATASAVLQGLRECDEAISRANAAGDLVRRDLERNPERIRDDDGFKRD